MNLALNRINVRSTLTLILTWALHGCGKPLPIEQQSHHTKFHSPRVDNVKGVDDKITSTQTLEEESPSESNPNHTDDLNINEPFSPPVMTTGFYLVTTCHWEDEGSRLLCRLEDEVTKQKIAEVDHYEWEVNDSEGKLIPPENYAIEWQDEFSEWHVKVVLHEPQLNWQVNAISNGKKVRGKQAGYHPSKGRRGNSLKKEAPAK